MHWIVTILASVAIVKGQDFASLLGPLLGGGGGGGGNPLGGILAGLGGGGGGKGPDIGSLFSLGAGLLGKGGGGAPMIPIPAPAARPAPAGRGGGIQGPTNIAVPDYSDYEDKTGPKPSPVQTQQQRKEQRQKARREKEKLAVTTETPDALRPPNSMTWMQGGHASNAGDIDSDYDIVGMTGPGARAAAPPPPSEFTPVGRSVQRAPNPVYHNPRARTFVLNQATLPPMRIYPQQFVQQPSLPPQQFVQQPQFPPQQFVQQPQSPAQQFVQQPQSPAQQQYWNWAPPTAAPIVATTVAPIMPVNTAPPFTLPPPEQATKPSPKLLAHNTARMIREIATFSDHHHGANEDYGAVQTLMEAFFEAIAEPKPLTVPQDPTRAVNIYKPMYDGTEMGANRPLTNKLFESDMVLTVEQMKGVVLASKAQRQGGLRRGKRKVITGSVYRWPRAPIPYRFKEGDEKWRNLIRSALKHWESETCVRWEENGRGKDHVIFFRGSGCYSSVGRTGGSQMISIGYGCEDKGIVCHEVGHSLGFWHEQSRPDRDRYISLNKQFIIRGTDGNFERRTTQEIEDMGLPYDMGSVMHYGPNAFTNDWDQITIKTNDHNYQRTIGQRAAPSFIDVKQVNRLYCNDVCAQLPCENGGYPDPNNCNVCKCPPGLTGRTCKEIPQVGCGGELTATPVWQELGHRGKRKCFWRIRTNNARIRFILSNVNYRCETTCRAYVEIKHNSDFQQTGFRACCNEGEIHVTSEQAEVLIIADSTELSYETGFNLRYIQDSGQPLPKPPPSVWVPGSENRGFRGSTAVGGPIEKFILNAIPKVRDPNRPWESIASIVAEYSLASLLGVSQRR
ncbi:hypothetical protein RB195_004166 [Necator americanus]|uniref:Metalloendopeptidase n=2 Tax=Necator americanus TaxID=51031 RepID=A0ABR1BKG2_NECAM